MRMALDLEIKLKIVKSLFLFLFIFLFFMSCKVNINKQLLEMQDNDVISIADLTRESSGTVYVIKGNLSEEKFLNYCSYLRKIDNFEFWEISLLVVDKKGHADVFIIHPFYNALSTLNLTIDVDTEKPYNINSLKIRKIAKDEYELFFH